MAELPARPSLDHLRHEARDLLRAAQAGDPAAVGRIRVVSTAPTLAGAQLALAREYGFASWARLKTAVEARTTDLARQAEMFCEVSIRDWTDRPVRMLAANPELAGYNFATAVILGDATRVRAEIARDPGLATRVDARTGWTALHAGIGSTRPGPTACWPWPGCCWTPEPTPAVTRPDGLAAEAAGPRCAAR